MTDFSSLVNFTGDLHGIAALAAARSLNLEKQASSPCFLNRDDRFFSRREHTLRVAPDISRNPPAIGRRGEIRLQALSGKACEDQVQKGEILRLARHLLYAPAIVS
jgi:hypothetical protein